jgi:hypothetical protein
LRDARGTRTSLPPKGLLGFLINFYIYANSDVEYLPRDQLVTWPIKYMVKILNLKKKKIKKILILKKKIRKNMNILAMWLNCHVAKSLRVLAADS